MDDVTRKVGHDSRAKLRVASAVLVYRPLDLRGKLTKIIDQWPLVLILFGGTLTLVWLATLIWLPLRLMHAV